MIDVYQLQAVCAEPAAWVAPLQIAMAQFAINTKPRAAMFLAQCAHESGRFVRPAENLNYSAAGLLKTWPRRFTEAQAADYAGQPRRIAARAYAGRGGNGDEASGDGWAYRGRGPLQITTRDNYAACGDAIGLPLLDQPHLLEEPAGGALSAAWFWAANGCNAVADEGDFAGVSGIINRGDRRKAALHLEERFQWLTIAQNALA
jgi:putative chitinase